LLDERFMVFQGKALDHFGGYSKAMDVYEDLEVINSDLHIDCDFSKKFFLSRNIPS
jgi:hypothetical protein